MYRGGKPGWLPRSRFRKAKPSAVIPSGLPQLNNTPFSLQQRPLSASPLDISQMMNRQVLPDRPLDVTVDKNNIHLLLPEPKKDTQYDPANPERKLLPEEAAKPKPIEGKDDKKEAVKEPLRINLNRFETGYRKRPNRRKSMRPQIKQNRSTRSRRQKD